MYIWRSLPKGQLAAVLEWVVSRRRARSRGQEKDRYSAAPPADSKDRTDNRVYPLQGAKAGAGQGPRK